MISSGALLFHEVDVDPVFSVFGAISDVHPLLMYVMFHYLRDQLGHNGEPVSRIKLAAFFPDAGDVLHLEANDPLVVDLRQMGSARGDEIIFFFSNPPGRLSKFDEASAAIAAHGTLATIGIIVFHFESRSRGCGLSSIKPSAPMPKRRSQSSLIRSLVKRTYGSNCGRSRITKSFPVPWIFKKMQRVHIIQC